MPLIWDVEYEDQHYVISLSVAWADIKDVIVQSNSGPPDVCARISQLALSQAEWQSLGKDFQEMTNSSAVIIDGYIYYLICHHLTTAITEDGIRKIGKLTLRPVVRTQVLATVEEPAPLIDL